MVKLPVFLVVLSGKAKGMPDVRSKAELPLLIRRKLMHNNKCIIGGFKAISYKYKNQQG